MDSERGALRLNAQGEDVASLHDQLVGLGYSVDAAERAMRLFGLTTRRHVMHVQDRLGLPATGVVDGDTARAIEQAVKVADRPTAAPDAGDRLARDAGLEISDRGSDCGSFLSDLQEARAEDRLLWGQIADPVAVPREIFACLFREALHPQRFPDGWFVWRDLSSEVAVDVGRSRTGLLPGFVICGLRMRCDQVLDTAELTVPLATGTVDEPAGLLMTGEIAARGDALLVDAWGDVAVAACWAAVVDVAIRVAAAAGIDACCGRLLPGAVWTAEDRFTVIPQARHAIDAPKAPA